MNDLTGVIPLTDYEKSCYNKGRADAFHEILNEMNKSPFLDKKVSMVKRYIAEQLKENKK